MAKTNTRTTKKVTKKNKKTVPSPQRTPQIGEAIRR